MKITRHNYEECFILYLDNELSSEDRRDVELFVKENPDLQPEFDLLVQSQLTADTSLVYAGKEQLLKSTSITINQENYEEWLLSYIDNELDTEEKKSVDQFLDAHPRIKSELEILQKTKLQPETIVFSDKQSLYRREEKVRLRVINWRRIAIAASLILAVGTTATLLLNKEEETDPVVAVTNEKKSIPIEKNLPQSLVEKEPLQSQVAANDQGNEITRGNVTVDATEKAKAITPLKEKSNTSVTKQEELAITPNEQKKSNELPEPIYNPNINKNVAEENPIAMNEPLKVKEALTKYTESSPRQNVTPEANGTYYTSNTPTETIQPVDENQPGKKNKLRGFFRKVTRTFEKNTNIKATDDEDRLLLGGLAIKL